MRLIHFFLFALISTTFGNCQSSKSLYPNDPIYFSQNFLLAMKTEQAYGAYRDTLAQIDLTKLKADLNNPEKKLAFWINTYNSLVQAKIRDNVEAFKDQESFFKTADQHIGGIALSLDDIESGILRKKERTHDKKFFRDFQVEKLDPRIHFTLNCGATSCPPIAFYSPEGLDKELAAAEESFVTQTSKFNGPTNTIELSELFKWYEDDFGGNLAIIGLLQRLKIVPPATLPQFQYTPYDWHLDVENYDE
jgi:hypothetical protein